jgi:hypothetical protein
MAITNLVLKKRSLTKWKKILKIFEEINQLNLTCNDCGYCAIYLKDDYANESNCKNCPLNKQHLCYAGQGESYNAVYNNIAERDGYSTVEKIRDMVTAIERDIQK